MNLVSFFVFLLLLEVSLSRTSNNQTKLGFIFVLTSQREHGKMQHPEIWGNFFNGSHSRSHFVSAVVNWPYREPIPSFIDEALGHETDYGGLRYLESIMESAELLFRKHQADAVIVLSGSCLPIRRFFELYNYLNPILQRNASVLPEKPANSSRLHLFRFTRISGTKIPRDEWYVHQAQGYCMHRSLFEFVYENWKGLSSKISNVPSADEHYLTFLLRFYARHENPSMSSLAKKMLSSLVRESLMYDEWKNVRGSSPIMWSTDLPSDLVNKLRGQNFFFMRKVLSTCKIDRKFLDYP